MATQEPCCATRPNSPKIRAKQQDEINGKKQALDAAQQKLKLQEQARNAGKPSE